MKLDRMKIRQKLDEAGVPEGQAVAHTEVYGEMQDELATKTDLKETREDLEGRIVETRKYLEGQIAETRKYLEERIDHTREVLELKIDSLRNEIKGDMSALEGRLIKWNMGAIFAAVGLVTAFTRFYPG